MKKHIDNLVIFSDMVIGKDGSGGWDETSRVPRGEFERLFREFTLQFITKKESCSTGLFFAFLYITPIRQSPQFHQ